MATNQAYQDGVEPTPTDTSSGSDWDVFTEYIRENPGICDTCFRRVKDYTAPPDDRWFDKHARSSDTIKSIVTEQTMPGMDGTYCHPPPRRLDTDQYRNRPAYGRIVCEACGHVDKPRRGFGPGLLGADADADDTLSKSQLKRATDRCISRLNEAGLSVHEHAVFSVVDSMKSKPRYAARDADIVRAALTIGVRRASGQR